jgi:hypothetical protein
MEAEQLQAALGSTADAAFLFTIALTYLLSMNSYPPAEKLRRYRAVLRVR